MHQFKNVLITLNYNDAETTIRFLERIMELKNIDYIVVVDNHSTDDSYLRLSEYKNKKTVVVQAASNGGYAKGNNFGAWYSIQQYNPDYLLISNPDVTFTDTAVEKMEAVLMKTPNAGAVACKMKCLSGGIKSPAWKLPQFSDCIKENLILSKKIWGDKTRYNENYLQSDSVVEVDVVPGSFFGISNNAFSNINGFNESTFLYGEENLMAYKLKKKGYQSYLITDEEFMHDHSVSIDRSIGSLYKKLRIGLDSRLIYADEVLNVKKTRRILIYLTFYIGAFNYLVLRKLLGMLGTTT